MVSRNMAIRPVIHNWENKTLFNTVQNAKYLPPLILEHQQHNLLMQLEENPAALGGF